MGSGRNKVKRQKQSAAEKGIKRHRRDINDIMTTDRARVNRWYKQTEAADVVERRRLAAEAAASAAQAIMDPRQDVEMTDDDASLARPTKKEIKMEAKANKFLYKTFPGIVSIAFPVGFVDNYKDPNKTDFSPLWDPEVIVSLRAALDFAHSMPKNGARLQGYVLSLFEAAIRSKEENPALFPAGQLVVPADQETFLRLVCNKINLRISAGSLGNHGRDLSTFTLARIIDGMSAARRAYRDAVGVAMPEATKKECLVIEVVDKWIDSFRSGSFLLQDLVVKSRGLMMPTLRFANK